MITLAGTQTRSRFSRTGLSVELRGLRHAGFRRFLLFATPISAMLSRVLEQLRHTE
jgi:hypothetical protein